MVKPPDFCSISPASRCGVEVPGVPKVGVRDFACRAEKFADRIHRHIIGRGQHIGDHADSHQLHRLRQVEMVAGGETRIDGEHRIRHQEKGVAVGFGARCRLRRDHAVGAGLVLNDDGDLEGLAKLLADDPGQRVGLSSRGISDQNCDDRDRYDARQRVRRLRGARSPCSQHRERGFPLHGLAERSLSIRLALRDANCAKAAHPSYRIR